MNQILLADEIKKSLDQNNGKSKVSRGKGAAGDPKHQKHGGRSVMGWAGMAADGTGSLLFIDDAGRSIEMSLEVYRALLSAHIQDDASQCRLIVTPNIFQKQIKTF